MVPTQILKLIAAKISGLSGSRSALHVGSARLCAAGADFRDRKALEMSAHRAEDRPPCLASVSATE